ncbi:hypothetical protein P5F75_05760 [Caldifermentibacillus hisashii]|uniref:hypothetical protein n=1 Tax=Caldifermentibacillus hisashii TaxID=996558 RepID=UPI002E2149ED|nr:hypothetical protein [Caldifermentibacillus hisashii]
MVTRKGLVAQKRSFSPKSDDENGLRLQKREFSGSKWRREKVSSSKNGVSRLKMVTRMNLVVKKWSFSAENGDENGLRRQKREFSGSKWRREKVSSSKNGVSRLKMVTRMNLVVKKWGFPAQNGDENGLRHPKKKFSGSKWRREKVSSSKNGIFRLKMATRMGFVTQKRSFPAQNGDENESRRQKMEFLG